LEIYCIARNINLKAIYLKSKNKILFLFSQIYILFLTTFLVLNLLIFSQLLTFRLKDSTNIQINIIFKLILQKQVASKVKLYNNNNIVILLINTLTNALLLIIVF